MGSIGCNSVGILRSGGLALAGVTTLLIGGAVAHAQTQTVDQRLDSIVTFGATQAQGVVQTPTLKTIYFTSDVNGAAASPIAGTNDLRACQGTGTRGLYCLDVDGGTYAVRRWQNPDKLTTYDTEITCNDLGMVTCTTMTVGLAGQIWVAGQKTVAGTYSLFKAVETVGDSHTCLAAQFDADPEAWTNTTDDRYCYREYASGRPYIHEISMIDGDAAAGFQGLGPGVLAIEGAGPTAVVFYQDNLPMQGPVAINDNWNNVLSNGEVFQSVTLLQLQYTNPVSNYVLVSTNLGKVLGYLMPWSGNSRPFDTGFRFSSLATTTGPACTPGAPYDLKASARTRRTYFTAGTCIAAFDPVLSGPQNRRTVTFPTQGFKLATDYDLVGVAVSPGIEIDFVRDGCTSPAGCTLLADGGDANIYDAARFANLQLANYDLSGWVLYQVTGLPDCRYISPRPAICTPSTVINPDGSQDDTATGDPTTQYLNISPLLPPEIRDAFPNGLPPMLLQPDYSARKSVASGRADYTFDALFGIPETGLGYRETFDGDFDIGDLIGSSLGCGGTQLQANFSSPPPWDVVVNISELAPTVGSWGVDHPPNQPPSIGTPNFVSMLLNSGCTNPTRLVGGRGSAFLYGISLSPKFQSSSGQWQWPDSAFALLMRSLARDFNDHLYTYACNNLDAPAGSDPPFSSATCYQLQKDWPVVLDKLTKCIDATDQPKNSSGNEACGSFETQFEAFKPQVLEATLFGPDPQNRVGETKARMIVLSYVYYSQFKPSLKPRGFVNSNE